jgi:hypothetical protein
MAESVVSPGYDGDELEVEELEDAVGGITAPLDEINSQCTVNGNCGCTT